MRPPGSALVSVAAAVVVAAAAVAGTAGGAQADLAIPTPTLSPLPSVSVLPLPLPTSSTLPLPLPSTSLTDLGSSPGATSLPAGSGGGSGGDGGSGTTSGGSTGASSGAPAAGSTFDVAPTAAAGSTAARQKVAAQRRADATPMIAGTAAAADLVDDEASPQLYRAGQDFLAADQGIAEIALQKRVLARLEQDAARTAQLYRAMGYDVAGAQRAAAGWHARYDALRPDTSADERQLVGDSATRADERVGELVVGRRQVRSEFEQIASRYRGAKRALADSDARLQTLAAQRSTALAAVQAARGSDVALSQARLAESGQLGAQIESLSEQLARRGRTVAGTGTFGTPLDGVVTSAFGMRYHPILHYTKLHTGTDFAGGPVIHAADDGRVIMTVLSTAYGNFTVIDHGVRDGKRVTTAYGHQARFLVEPGQRVSRGDPIGIVGSTGYSTGPHLHFEVRENGAVVDPMRYLR